MVATCGCFRYSPQSQYARVRWAGTVTTYPWQEKTRAMRAAPWYTGYADLRDKVRRLKIQFEDRCRQLGAKPRHVTWISQVSLDVVARAVHESNWQEGIYLPLGRTRELANAAFDDLSGIQGPHLNMPLLLDHQRRDVIAMKRRHASDEEIAGLNLLSAHLFIPSIAVELQLRSLAALLQPLNTLVTDALSPDHQRLTDEARTALDRVRDAECALRAELTTFPTPGPFTQQATTQSQVLDRLLDLSHESLLHPMNPDYLHFLHRLVLMGISPPSKLGTFRINPVTVGDPRVAFPPPAVVPGLIDEYCAAFPTLSIHAPLDPILKAAEVSFNFVRIHPYSDGNGRVSRLLMNLVLFFHFPPASIKADKKGRHRYRQALSRAERGDYEPLACLIARSLISTYEELLRAVRNRSST